MADDDGRGHVGNLFFVWLTSGKAPFRHAYAPMEQISKSVVLPLGGIETTKVRFPPVGSVMAVATVRGSPKLG